MFLGLRRYVGAYMAVLKHLVLLPVVSPGRTNMFAQRVLAAQDDISYRGQTVPAHEAWELFPGLETASVNLERILPDEGSSVSTREMIVLCGIVKAEEAQRVFEIGTSLGVTSCNLALNLPAGGMLYTLDLPPVDQADDSAETKYAVSISDRKMIFAGRQHRRFLDSAVRDKVVQLYGDSATFDYSPHEGKYDIVFVDGAHSLSYVRSDTEAALRLVKPGGLILWHDFNDGFFWPDVHKYLAELGKRLTINRIAGTTLAVTRAVVPDRPASAARERQVAEVAEVRAV